MRRTDVPATKSTLLRMREQFVFVQAGHKLLEQKREVLLEELIQIAREAKQSRRQLAEALATAYATLGAALVTDGRPPLEAEALAASPDTTVRVRERSVMGVAVPILSFEGPPAALATVAPGTASPGAARTGHRIRALLTAIVRQAEVEVSCRRLAAELQKTQRRVNALENIFIPEYRDTIRFIEGSLEEKEREGLFQMKRLKGRHAAGDGGSDDD